MNHSYGGVSQLLHFILIIYIFGWNFFACLKAPEKYFSINLIILKNWTLSEVLLQAILINIMNYIWLLFFCLSLQSSLLLILPTVAHVITALLFLSILIIIIITTVMIIIVVNNISSIYFKVINAFTLFLLWWWLLSKMFNNCLHFFYIISIIKSYLPSPITTVLAVWIALWYWR